MLEIFHQERAIVGEAPVWLANRLYWVDVESGCVYWKSPGEPEAAKREVGCRIGSIAPTISKGWITATENGVGQLDIETASLSIKAHPERHLPGNRFNDGKCDPCGRFVAGTMSTSGERNQGSLYVIEPDWTTRRIYGPVSVSNGLAWSEDGTTFYYNDSPSRCVRAFAYDCATGEISDERIIARVPDNGGVPDGMTIDNDGNLWVCLWGGGAVECWDPRRSKRLTRIELGVSKPTSCTFGGKNFDRLYVTSASIGLSADELAREPHAGCVFELEVGVQGRAPQPFAFSEFVDNG